MRKKGEKRTHVEMANFIDTVKAIITRLIFSTHGVVAIYRVVTLKDDPWFWYLAVTILLLFFEGVFTLTIKKTQEWKWFCPSVFLYLASVCPSIWLIELDKLDTRLAKKEELEARQAGIEVSTSTTTSSPILNALVTTTIPNEEIFNETIEGNKNGSGVNLGVLKDVGVSSLHVCKRIILTYANLITDTSRSGKHSDSR